MNWLNNQTILNNDIFKLLAIFDLRSKGRKGMNGGGTPVCKIVL